MFGKIYAIYEKEIAGIPFVCKEGCAVCCTQSVTMTTSEGRAILAFMAEKGRALPALPNTKDRPKPVCTTNNLAACCLAGKELPAEPDEPWIYEPCVFLEDDRCSIYPVRPFGCKSFGSTISCVENGIAEAPEWFVTLNTVVTQLIEHLDRDGYWGNMLDVLDYLNQEGVRPSRLLPTQPLPGFLIPSGEEDIINRFLEKLAKSGISVGS